MTDTERPAADEQDGEDETRDPSTGLRDAWPELPGDKDRYLLALGDGTVPLPSRADATPRTDTAAPASTPPPATADATATDAAAKDAVARDAVAGDAAIGDATVGDGTVGDGAEFPLWERPATATATLPDRPVPRREPATAVPRRPRRPLVGLPLLLVLGLLAAFFGWVGAEPFWIAVGHADRGTLAVTYCTGGGITKRCTGDFTAAGARHPVRDVALSGDAVADAHAGTRVAARMVGPSARTAYSGDGLGLLLRWAVPLALIVLIGLLVAAATGAWRLRGRHRFAAVVLSLLGPLALAAGITAVAW